MTDIDVAIDNLPVQPKPKRGGQPAVKGIARNKKKQRLFLKTLKDTFNFSAAAKSAGVSPSTVYAFMERCPEFNALVEEARMEACSEMEGEAYRRAVTGVEEPVFYQGNVVGSVTKYSDTLLQFMMRNNIANYQDKSSLDVNVSGNIEVSQAKQKLLSMLNINPEDIIDGEFTDQ